MAFAQEIFVYPPTRMSDQSDDYHGTAVADPYRWLEDTDSPETRSWIEAQNKITFGFLEKIPRREALKARLTKLWNYERYGVPHKEGESYFFQKNDGLQNQSVLYVALSLDAAPRVLLDPNSLSADGTVSLTTYSISDDGKLLAYGLSRSGSDWIEFHVRDVATGKDLPDVLNWIKFSGAAWTKDGRGFFYCRYDEPKGPAKLEDSNFYMKLCHHRIGTPQSEDALVYKRDDQKEWSFHPLVSEDGRYLVIDIWKSTGQKNQVFYRDLQDPEGKVVELIAGFEHGYEFIGNDGPVFWFNTNREAPRRRVIAVDIRKPEPANWVELIPQAKDPIESASVVGERFIVKYLHDAHSQVKLFGLDGKFQCEVELPGLGTAGGFGGKRADRETFYAFTGFTTPAVVFRYDIASGKSSVFREPRLAFDPARFETKQVFFPSKDGTRIPMFITHRKGLKLDGSNPTYLYGYGGFNIPLTPAFSVSILAWMELGGVYAMPNLRGGGEYGEDWHEAGKRARKQNVFDDFISAAQWLIDNKYTCTSKLAIGGGSNGGLLVGACMTQRPDLFGAALPEVGVLDMLRYHKFTIGWAWADEFGSSDKADEFKVVHAYSPLHNIKKGARFPATMICTADHDDRVVPGHSFKFAAALQAAQAGPAPALIRIDVKAGHGMGKPTAKLIEACADRWAFLVKVLGME